MVLCQAKGSLSCKACNKAQVHAHIPVSRLACIDGSVLAREQCMAVYLLGTTVFAYFKRPRSHAVLLTILLFFCNGGLGFAYFLHWPKEQK